MFYFPKEKSFDKNEVYIYIERYNKQESCILFDFIDSNEFGYFSSLLSFEYDWLLRPTMVEVTNYNQRPLREGSTYRISKEALEVIIQRLEVVDDSFVIGFKLNFDGFDQNLVIGSKTFTELERFQRNIDQSHFSSLPNLDLNFTSFKKVIVRNVGQGNWNEIDDGGKTTIVFDAGTIYTTKKSQLLKYIGNRNCSYQEFKPLIILSHWDVDHYHFLIGFDDDTIKAFPYFIFRGIIPNLTARKLIGRFLTLNPNAIIPIAPESPNPKRSSDKLIRYYLSGNKQLLFFNSAKNSSRNKSGLGFTIRTKQTSVVFSGDYNYSQISDHILPELCYSCNHYLIVPHHGGKAGKFKYSHSTFNKLEEAIISVGKNPYKPKHPHANNIKALATIGFKVIRTDIKACDYEITL